MNNLGDTKQAYKRGGGGCNLLNRTGIAFQANTIFLGAEASCQKWKNMFLLFIKWKRNWINWYVGFTQFHWWV